MWSESSVPRAVLALTGLDPGLGHTDCLTAISDLGVNHSGCRG